MYNMNDLEHMAADEFDYFYNKQGDEKTRKIQPTLKCFCEYQAEENYYPHDTNLSLKLKLAKNKEEEVKK